MLRTLLLLLTLALPAAAQTPDDLGTPPAGAYILDLGHARLTFRVNHLGFSRYTALFTRFDAKLTFDPANPAAMQVSATIDATSVETHYPDPAIDFNATLRGPDLLDAAAHPTITFTSTAVTPTGPNTADITGTLTLRGIAKPVTLHTTYNGGWAGHPMDPAGARAGFSAETRFKRSDFGMTYGLPAPGSTMGVFDEIEVFLEAEFTSTTAKP